MLSILHSTGKLPAAIRPQKILVNLGAKKTAILFKTKEKYYVNLNYNGD